MRVTVLILFYLPSSLTLNTSGYKSFSQAQTDITDLVVITHDPSLAPEILGSVTYAVQDFSAFNVTVRRNEMFCSQKTLFLVIQPPDHSSFFYYMTKICSALRCEREKHEERWKPYILLIYPKNGSVSSKAEFEKKIINSYNSSCMESGNNLTMDSNFFILSPDFENTNDSSKSLIFELYSIQNLIFLREVSMHNKTHQFQPFQRKLTRRHNFMGVKIRAIVQAETQYFATVQFRKIGDKVVMLDGYDVQYFHVMSSSLNFTTIGVLGKGWIKDTGSETLNGIGKQLMDGEGDIVISQSEYMIYRLKKLSFLQPHFVTRIIAFFQQPVATSTRDIYIRSIPNNVRFAIVCTCLFTTGCLIVISVVGRKFYQSHDYLPEYSIGNIFHWVIAANCQQGSHIHPTRIPMKIGVFVAYLFGILVYISFSASVVSQLSIPFIPIKSFDDILKSGMNISLDGLTQTAMEFLAKAQADKRVDSSRISTPPVPHEDVVGKIAEGRLAFLTLANEFYLTQRALNHTDRELCKAISRIHVDPIGLPVLAGMLVHKSSPYLEFFKYKQIQIREVGLYARLQEAFRSKSIPNCQYIKSKKTVYSLGLNDTITAFIFLIVSFFLSLVALCFERSLRKTSAGYEPDEDQEPDPTYVVMVRKANEKKYITNLED